MSRGYLLIQLGTPRAAEVSAVREYLMDFLGDPRLVLPRPPLWDALLRWIIVPRRAPRTCAQYAQIANGTELPLARHSRELSLACQRHLRAGEHLALSFQIGAPPSVEEGLLSLLEAGCTQIRVLPLYPQNAEATTIAAQDRLCSAMDILRATGRILPPVEIAEGFAALPAYIHAFVHPIVQALQQQKADAVLLSFHGYPLSRIRQGDPYERQCLFTAQAIEAELRALLGSRLPPVQVTYQSRFGSARWLEPSTSDQLIELAQSGIRHLLVACPAFVGDNLETLYEVDIELRDEFLSQGGETFRRVLCPNGDSKWAQGLVEFLRDDAAFHPFRSDWPDSWGTRWA